VFFDNLQVGIIQGNIAEENHYYAYGLKIATLSSKKLGDSYEGQLKNNYLYQGAFSELDEDIGWNDFMLRNYDAQIGRWVQQDPYDQFASPYIGIGDDPINNIDPSGGITYCPGTSALAIFLDKAIYALSQTSPALFKLSVAISITNTALFIGKMAQTSNMINGQIRTMQAGGDYITPGGKQMSIEDDSPELFDGSAGKVGDLTIQPMKGSLKAFTVRGDDVDNGAARFVAMFSTETGKFIGYSWDKKPSYTYDDFLNAARKDIVDQYKHAEDIFYQHYNNHRDALTSLINLNLAAVLPNPILKTTTGLANVPKLLRLRRSVETVLGKLYKSVAEVVVPIKNEGLLKALNAASKGKGQWEKVYQAGIQNGEQVEVHFFRNSNSGRVYDVKVKYNYWHQKAFKNLSVQL
jgi:RHS repeat-associated protein